MCRVKNSSLKNRKQNKQTPALHMQAQRPLPLRLSDPASHLGDEDYSVPQDRSTSDAEIQP